MRYTAINIGPILSTFTLVRKPRDLWAASYLFSFLMECIIEETNNKLEEEDIQVFSPRLSLEKEKMYGVGLYPDRVYCTGSWDFKYHRKLILDAFVNGVGIKDSDREDFKKYFNVMCVSIDGDGKKETVVIQELNQLLDALELNGRAISESSQEVVWSYIYEKSDRETLFRRAFVNGEFGKVSVSEKSERYYTLGEYASIQLRDIASDSAGKWNAARNASKLPDLERVQIPGDFEIKEDVFFKELSRLFENDIKTYHKYICIVQADGDNMGKTFTHSDLPNGVTSVISGKLVDFGINATKAIYEYGGLPIYAGGDDLLFLAPVVGITKNGGKPKNIFDLIEDIDNCFKPVEDEVVGRHLPDINGKDIKPSMSYGVSVTYNKFPLYEALESARLLLEKAKNLPGKSAIAVAFRKNSGSVFHMELSKNKETLYDAFRKVIEVSSVGEPVVSAVGFKIRNSEGLFSLWAGKGEPDKRNQNMFKTFLEYDPQKKDNANKYKGAALTLLNQLFATLGQDVSTITQTLYSMLRIAKFINGEKIKDV